MNGVGTVDSYRPLSEIYCAWVAYNGYTVMTNLSIAGDGSLFHYFVKKNCRNIWSEDIVNMCNKEMRSL